MNILFIIASFAVSALVSLVVLPRLLVLCHRYRLYDQPSERKVHKNSVPRLGGVVFFPAMLFGMLTGILLSGEWGAVVSQVMQPHSLIIAVGGMLLYAIGIVDDLYGVSANVKFCVQLISAVLLPSSGLYIGNLCGFMGIHELPLWCSYSLTVFLTLLIVNAINLIDGIDGLAASLSLIALVTFGWRFCVISMSPFAICCSSLGGAVVTYLGFNMFGSIEKHTKTFMGDSGSLLLGFVLSLFTLKLAQPTTIVPSFGAEGAIVVYTTLLIPCFDLVRVALCRLLRFRGIFKADKTHIHHKLMAVGMTMRQAFCIVVLMQIAFIVLNYTLFKVGTATEVIAITDVIIYTIINVILPTGPKAKG